MGPKENRLSGITVAVEVKTIKGNFSFPITMKMENHWHPIIKRGWHEAYWEYADGAKLSLEYQNCPLYMEIYYRLYKK